MIPNRSRLGMLFFSPVGGPTPAGDFSIFEAALEDMHDPPMKPLHLLQYIIVYIYYIYKYNNINKYIYIYWQCLTSSSPYYLYAILNCQSTDIRPSSPSRWTWLVPRSSPNGRFDIWGFLGLFSMINVIRPYLLVGLQWVSPTPVSFKP